MKKITLILFAFTLLTSSVNAQISLGSGLSVSYPFTGNANDATGGGLNGTVYGATLTSDRFGNPNQAYFYNGSSSYINYGNILNSVFAGAGNKYSLSVWIKPASVMNNNFILAKTADGGCSEAEEQIYFRILYGQVNFTYCTTLYSGNAAYPSGTMMINDTSMWYHIVVLYDGTVTTGGGVDRVKIYVNNVSDVMHAALAPTGTIGDIQTGTAPMGTGIDISTPGSPCSSAYFNGKIDDLRIYDRLLNTSEINALYLGPTNVGISEIKDKINYSVYPNPTNGKLNLLLDDTFNHIDIKVFNVIGQAIYQESAENKLNYTIDLANQPKGVYFVQVQTEKGKTTKKIVIAD